MAVIVVTGTPGTGKTELAKELAKTLDYEYVDVNEVVKNNRLVEEHDRERDTDVVDEEKLSKALVHLIKNKNKHKKSVIIDSHMSHEIPSKYVDLCIVARCGLKVLKKRLEKKGYKKSKVRENLDAEIIDVCLSEAMEAGHNVLIVETSVKKPKQLVKSLVK